MKKTAYTLRFFYTGELNKDTSFSLDFLDIRRNNPEAVDTGAKYIDRSLRSTFVFCFEDFDHVRIGTTCRDFLTKTAITKDYSELPLGCESLVFCDKLINKVTRMSTLNGVIESL